MIYVIQPKAHTLSQVRLVFQRVPVILFSPLGYWDMYSFDYFWLANEQVLGFRPYSMLFQASDVFTVLNSGHGGPKHNRYALHTRTEVTHES